MWRLIGGWGTVVAFAVFGGDLLSKSVLDKPQLERCCSPGSSA
jgi:hypothetical protein